MKMKIMLTVAVLTAWRMPLAAQAPHPREAVLAAEAAFVAQAAKAGIPAAFVAHSAPNGFVADEGRLANAQEVWRARPAQPGVRLAWSPAWVDAAQSGELAYTAGPWASFQNSQPQTNGEYVTVWRKQPDGQWKFVVDLSVERVGVPPAPGAAVPRPQLMVAVATPSTAPANIVLDVDRKFAAAQLFKPGATYQQYLSAETRLYRPGLSMMQGAAAVANMKNLDGGYVFTPTDGYLAAAGDLGYVVGTLHRAAAGPARPAEDGSYLRIWRREAVAGWRIAVEIFNLVPVPPTAAAGTPDASTTGQLPTH